MNRTLKSIEDAGYPATNAYLKWATIACAGNFCGKTIDHPKNRAKETVDYLEKRFGDNLKKVKLRIGFSGCPNGCARHLIADIGLQGMMLTSEGKSLAGYNLYIKENNGQNPTLGKLIQRGISAEQVKFAVANLIEAYLNNGADSRFNEFCNTKTMQELQAIINSTLKQKQ